MLGIETLESGIFGFETQGFEKLGIEMLHRLSALLPLQIHGGNRDGRWAPPRQCRGQSS